MAMEGALLSLPSGMAAWTVNPDCFVATDFERVVCEADKIDMFMLGCGENIQPLPIELRQLFKEHKIALDTMPTAAAARTYNILLSEGRRVACGLIAVA
jgi:uncharacterized protein